MPYTVSNAQTRRKFLVQLLATTAATALASETALARRPFYGGAEIPALGGTFLTTFDVSNSVAASSLGMIRVGLPIKPNDCPPGRTLEIQRGGGVIAAQFDKRASWKTNPAEGVQYCTACIRDTDFAALETRTYFLFSKSGSFVNTSSVSLAAALSGTDYKVDFSSINGDVSGVRPDLSARLNTHAARATRVTKNESGPVCDSYSVWGMAANGATEDAHLKTVAHFSQWKDSLGNSVAHELCFVVQLDWWAVPNKEGMIYTATLRNGATTIQTYSGVDHPYQTHWATVRLQDDDQHARRHWIGRSRPTLVYKPTPAYWRSTGIAPPYDTDVTLNPDSIAPVTYTPCSSQGHRADIDGTGGYYGEGLWSTADVVAFNRMAPIDIRRAICAGFAGLHINYHFRSEKTRARPGEGSDIANTVIPLIMWDERGGGTPSSYYTFTADGMPTPAHAYANSFSGAQSDGFVIPPGVPQSGSTFWSVGYGEFDTPVHAAMYSDFCYIYTGEQYYLDASVDIALASLNINVWAASGAAPPNTFGVYPSTELYPGTSPGTLWSAISAYAPYVGITRRAAWAVKMMVSMSVVPDNDVQANYLQALIVHTCKYIEQSYAKIPSDGNGAWSMGAGTQSTFMNYYLVMGFYFGYARTRRAGMKTVAEYVSKFPIQWAQYNLVGLGSIYQSAAFPSSNIGLGPYDSVNNHFFQDGWYTSMGNVSISAATDVLNIPYQGINYTNGDEIMAYDATGGTYGAPPTETPLGTKFYMINVSGTTCKISATKGGSPVNFTSDYPNVHFIGKLHAAATRNGQSGSSYGAYARCAFMLARWFGHPDATANGRDQYDAWYPVGTQPNNTNFSMLST